MNARVWLAGTMLALSSAVYPMEPGTGISDLQAFNSRQFTDATAAAGLKFTHNSGAAGKKYLPETMGSGCAFLDVDGDGWQDVLFVQSMNWPGRAGAKTTPVLYRNNGNGTFTDITPQAGLAVPMYGLGV